MNTAQTEKLFSYGTLQDASVQMATFGRLLEGTKDILKGYRLDDLRITDPHVIAVSGKDIHRILVPEDNGNSQVAGTVFELASEELQQADSYEVSDYKRVLVELASGIKAWVYAHQSILQD